MRLMIVEDQEIILRGIAKMIGDSMDIEIVTALDGQEALETIERNPPPDIILTDIVMPELDGLSFIRQAALKLPVCKFIILSGYDLFRYAKEAMQLGVRDYLLKPIDRGELIGKLKELTEQIIMERATLSRQIELAYGQATAKQSTFLSQSLNWPEIPGELSAFFLVRCPQRQEIAQWPRCWKVYERPGILSAYVRRIGQDEWSRLRAEISGLPDLAYGCDTEIDEAFCQCVLMDDNRFGLGDAVDESNLAAVCAALEQIDTALVIQDLAKLSIAASGVIDALSAPAIPARHAKDVLKKVFDRFASAYNSHELSLSVLWIEAKDYGSFLYSCRQELSRILSEGGVMRNIVDQVKYYIDTHCDESLTLHDVAANVHITPNYLSFIFKRDTGETLSAYIRKRQMNVARHLLRTTDKRVYEIAEQLGYKDVEYFSMLFKKYHGLSPNTARNEQSPKSCK